MKYTKTVAKSCGRPPLCRHELGCLAADKIVEKFAEHVLLRSSLLR